MALTVGSCAAEHHESGQIREEAALNGTFRVPQGCLTRAGGHHQRQLRSLEGGGTITLLTPWSRFSVRIASHVAPHTSGNGFAEAGPVDEAEEAHSPNFLDDEGADVEQGFRRGKRVEGAVQIPVLPRRARKKQADQREDDRRSEAVEPTEQAVSGAGSW